ncbi:MAG: hypothetical protein IJ597_03290 [Synergistaceae bacterium]|nr:hypothetical protein [Synergistaceae bacterium]
MTKQYSKDHNDNLYIAQDILLPYSADYGRRDRNFSSARRRRFYKVDKDFTPEERTKILARVSEVGATRAADEFGTRRWVIMQWLDNLEKFGSIDNPKHKNKNNNSNNKNKKRGFDKKEQNSVSKKTSVPQAQRNEQDFSKKSEIEDQNNDFKNFEFNFDEILQEKEKAAKPGEVKEVKKNSSNVMKTSEDFTLEQRNEILKLSDEIGIKRAALQAHTKIDVIKYWRKIRKNKTDLPIKKEDTVSSIENENEILKIKAAELDAEVKKLTEELNKKISFSVKDRL